MKELIGGIILGVCGLIALYFKTRKKSKLEVMDPSEETKIYDNYEAQKKKVYDKNPELKSNQDVLKELNRHRDSD